jgi:tRNA-Thr(GGU) m(6)t(6)A37 methyltransferase TsaA
VVRGSGHALGFLARGPIVMEAQRHPELAEYTSEPPAVGQGGGLFVMRPIGVIHSPFMEKDQTPIQPTRSQARGRVEVFAEFAEGLQDIEGFSHLILLYAFHRSAGYELRVQPFLDDRLHGLFATRYPRRPNPIGLSVVRLLARSENEVDIEGVDVLDGTPLLDIKPYVPDFDAQTEVRTGWYESRRGGAPR